MMNNVVHPLPSFAESGRATTELLPPARKSSPRGKRCTKRQADPVKEQDCPAEAADHGPDQAGTDWEAFYRESVGLIYSVARRMLDTDADAEDVTQDVLLKAMQKLGTFRGEASVTTWLYRVTVNAVLALRRKRATARERRISEPGEALIEAPAGREPAAAPDQQAERRELRDALEDAITRLPKMYRDPYVLADVEGLSNADVGSALGLSLAAVKSRLHRARLMMRETLAPYCTPECV